MPMNSPQGNINHSAEHIETDRRPPAEGIALCLSGGGYRAMVFHVGALWRLYDAGWLGKLDRISSVSGGSISAAALGLAWDDLQVDASPDRERFDKFFVKPIRRLAEKTIDVGSVIGGILLPGNINKRVQYAYRKHLFGNATLQELPDKPRFVINATNVQSGVLWRFSKPYMRDYRVGEVKNPTIKLAAAVAASSAFPPVLSPMIMKLDPISFTLNSGIDLQKPPYTSRVVLSDGGVYDNLGLETAWKRYRTILVSDAGGKLSPEGKPRHDWAQHSYRVLELIDNQVRNLRKRLLIQSYIDNERQGAYWGIRTDIADYGLENPLDCRYGDSKELANISTRLAHLNNNLQERLINWGYAVCDAAMRRHVDHTISKGVCPYPDAAA